MGIKNRAAFAVCVLVAGSVVCVAPRHGLSPATDAHARNTETLGNPSKRVPSGSSPQMRVPMRPNEGNGSGTRLDAFTATPRGASPERVARSYARHRLRDRQDAAAQMRCLDALWKRESNWRWNARNKSSGAYGIPQALPAEKMSSAGADWRTNPRTQVRWGLRYITARYGSPCGALEHHNRRGWY